jgi:hypothetical protein
MIRGNLMRLEFQLTFCALLKARHAELRTGRELSDKN